MHLIILVSQIQQTITSYYTLSHKDLDCEKLGLCPECHPRPLKNKRKGRRVFSLPDHILDPLEYQNSPLTAQNEDHKQGPDWHLLVLSNWLQVWLL